MAKPLSVPAWFKQLPPPTEANRRTEAAFLEEHWQYGGRVHEETVKAIVGALSQPSEVAVGHGLFLRLFTEFANALETLGVWGWTIRNRRDFPLLLDGFLAYPYSAPREFFQAVKRNRSGSIILLLKLPPEERLIPAVAAGFAQWTRTECRRALAETFTSLRQSADHYFAEDEIFRTTYNKAKHGATMVRTADLGSPAVLRPCPSPRRAGGTRQSPVRPSQVHREQDYDRCAPASNRADRCDDQNACRDLASTPSGRLALSPSAPR